MPGPDNLEVRNAGGGNPAVDGKPKPLQGPIVEELLGILPKKLQLAPEDLLGYPDTRILENNEDPDDETLGASSLQALRAMNAVEERWGFTVDLSELSSFRTFRSIVDRVEAEIAANSWLTVPADKNIIFNTPFEQRWTVAALALGINVSLISSIAGHA